MIAIVTAGGSSQPGDPLYEITGGGLKAMIRIENKPMVQWVLDALSASQAVDRVIVVGLSPETPLDCAHPLTLLPDIGGMLENIRAGATEALAQDPTAEQALLANGDLPGLRPEIVDWLIGQAQDETMDIYYTVISRETMEKVFPASRRTYIHLKDTQLCGGDLHVIRLKAAVEESPLWDRLVISRKSPVRQASLIGYDTLLLLLLRQLKLKDAQETVCRRMGIRGTAVVSPYAELGMDVDKPFQLEIIRDHLAKQCKKQAAGA